MRPDAAREGPFPRVPPGEVVLRRCVGEPDLDYYTYVPASARAGARLLVAVHGIAERAEGHARFLAHPADRHGVVIAAPHFARPDYRDYQRLGRLGRGARADRALERMVAEVGRITGATVERFYLFGFSGGAQFVHRYVMAHPSRVAGAVLSSAGWYTWPDSKRRYPYGIARSRRLPDLHFDPDAFLRVPLLVTVGELDTERDAAMRSSPELDQQQGRNRLERAERWTAAMQRAARERGLPPAVTCQRLPAADHYFPACMERGGLGEKVLEHLVGTGAPGARGVGPGAAA